MKVKLSKNMKLIAMIVLGVILITYVFYNSIKEDFGKKKGKKKKGGGYKRDVFDGNVKCVEKEKKKGKKACYHQDPASKDWVKCDKNNKDHKKTIDKWNEGVSDWANSWCLQQQVASEVGKMRTEPGSKEMMKWYDENHKKWKGEAKLFNKEFAPIMHLQNEKSTRVPYAGLAPFFHSMIFKPSTHKEISDNRARLLDVSFSFE
jgi:hypothetical protein